MQLYWGYIRVVLGFYRVYIGLILGLDLDCNGESNGQENGT